MRVAADTDGPAHRPLRRELGVFGATMMGIGAMMGTGVFVSVGIAAGAAGPPVILAIALAGLVALCNALSSAQLAASHPVSGGTYEYGYRYLCPVLGFSAGWLFLWAKSASAATAALGFTGYLLHIIGKETLPSRLVAVGTVAVVSGLILLGMRRSSALNIIIVSITVLSLGTFTAFGLPAAASRASENLSPVFPADLESFGRCLEACALMFVAYTGYGRIATMGEEVKEPEKTIPRAIVVALAVTAVVYLAVCVAAVGAYGAAELGETTRTQAAPLESVLMSLGYPYAAKFVAVGAVTAMLGVLLNLVLGLSRVILAMGRRGDLPRIFATVNRGRSVPSPAVVAVTLIVAGLCALGDVKLTWSFSAFTVLFYYAVTNLAALRMLKDRRRYSPVFPWIGLASCIFLAFWVEWRVWLSGLGVMAIGLIWHFNRLPGRAWHDRVVFKKPQ